MSKQSLVVRSLGRQDYEPVWQAMSRFARQRGENNQDEIWLLEHNPVFTQGQAGKAEHLLEVSEIPLVQSDRGGQVTYHGPGQLVAYLLFDLHRMNKNVRELVTQIEQSLVKALGQYAIEAYTKADAPGVYVAEKKIASLGLRVSRGKSFHGLSLNVDMDLTPFEQINPCGYAGLAMTQMKDLLESCPSIKEVAEEWLKLFVQTWQYHQVEYTNELPGKEFWSAANNS